jgi:hypothetical protein
MNKCTQIGLFIAAMVAPTGAAPAPQGYPQYALSWRGVGYTRNAAGNVVKMRMSDRDLVQKAAVDNGLNASELALVYRVEARDTAVVRKKDGSFVADVMQVQYVYVDVPNANGTTVVRQAMLYDEAHDMTPIGSVFGTETSRTDASGNLKSYSFRGSFQYAIAEDDAVYSGTFTTGKPLFDTTRGP